MRLAGLSLGVALLCAASPAEAALTLCNRTSYVLYAATAAIKTPQSETQGWTRVAPGDCQVARKEALTAEIYLVHARSSLSHSGPARAWGGGFPMCVKDTDFNLTQSGAMAVCSSEGSFTLPFAALDMGGRANWTMTLDEQPVLASLTAAQLAGAKRLLRDNGFDPGPIDSSTSKLTGVALTAARKEFAAEKLANVALFARLESEARRTNSPSGYTVCNDADDPLDVALAEVAKGKPVSRGWWTVPRGACARASTAPLAKGTAYYLFARRKDGTTVASGKEIFCIAPTAFEIAARGGCAARRQQEAGFVRTQTGGLGGYTARIAKAGLSAAQVTISK
jgi:uncharacterized membrane protein